MTLNEYQEAAAKTAIYPEANDRTLKALTYCILGLCGEAGEAANQLQKILRAEGKMDGKVMIDIMKKISLELGGSLWFISQAALEMGYSLHEIGMTNLAILADRYERGVIDGSGDDR